jgi:hypothetical protein
MTTRTTQKVTSAGVAGTYFTPTASDRFSPGSILHVKNANASICNVTQTPAGISVEQATVAGTAVAVPATTGDMFIFITDNAAYRDPSDGLVGVTFSVQTSVSCAVIARQ